MPLAGHHLSGLLNMGLRIPLNFFLRFGADPSQRRSTKDGGHTPLIHLAITRPSSSRMDSEVVKTWTPLHIAASWSLFNITDLLLQEGQGSLD